MNEDDVVAMLKAEAEAEAMLKRWKRKRPKASRFHVSDRRKCLGSTTASPPSSIGETSRSGIDGVLRVVARRV